jgi:putative transposase
LLRRHPAEVSAFIDQEREQFAVELICRTVGTSVSGYYARRSREPSTREVEDQRLLPLIRQTHVANYEAYANRRMWKALRRAGHDVPHCQVQRRMQEHGIVGAKRCGKPWRTTVQDPSATRAPDLVDRDFTADAPNVLWIAEFTYARCWEGRVFFSFVLDVFSRMVVGWQFTDHMRTSLVEDAVEMALGIRERGADAQLVHPQRRRLAVHVRRLPQALEAHHVLASIGSVGDTYDNAMAESFVDTFKTELIADRVWRSKSQLELAIVEWVGWYNHARPRSALDDVPPSEHETA